jgi:tetratricopeptide (TPR) repeat protein
LTINRIARTYYKQNKFEEALLHYIKALEIEQKSLSNDHSSIATSYFNISTAYVGLSRWTDAAESAFKAIEQIKK